MYVRELIYMHTKRPRIVPWGHLDILLVLSEYWPSKVSLLRKASSQAIEQLLTPKLGTKAESVFEANVNSVEVLNVEPDCLVRFRIQE